MPMRLSVRTRSGLQNFLKIEERKNGDLILSTRGDHEGIALPGLEPATHEGKRIRTAITVHPNLKSQIGSITINYKSLDKGTEIDREVVHVLDVKQGGRLFPVLADIGSNIGGPSLSIDPSTSDGVVHLWSGQEFDWSVQSLAYCVLLANRGVEIRTPHNCPAEVLRFDFQHLQVVVLYWALDRPTKGASLGIALEPLLDGAISGLDLPQVNDLVNALSQEHEKRYELLPDFLPGQLPERAIQCGGVRVVPQKWHFKEFHYRIEAIRDESLLRLSFCNIDGNTAIVDLNGKDITHFQEEIAKAIRSTPGLAVWKDPVS